MACRSSFHCSGFLALESTSYTSFAYLHTSRSQDKVGLSIRATLLSQREVDAAAIVVVQEWTANVLLCKIVESAVAFLLALRRV